MFIYFFTQTKLRVHYAKKKSLEFILHVNKSRFEDSTQVCNSKRAYSHRQRMDVKKIDIFIKFFFEYYNLSLRAAASTRP
jgi:hypothetical protein